MKIKEILNQIKSDHIIAEARGKAIIEQIQKLWSDKLTPDEAVEMLNWFDGNSQHFKVSIEYTTVNPETNEPVKYSRVNPTIGKFMIIYPKFKNDDDLKDPTKYTGEEIEFLFNEFNFAKIKKDSSRVEPEVFIRNPGKNPNNPTRLDRSNSLEKVVASKNLWYDNEKSLINENGFRVYAIDTQFKAMYYGYYLDSFHGGNSYSQENRQLHVPGTTWCTTSSNDGSTFYGSQRNNRSFYFVIDESKHPRNFIGENPREERIVADGSRETRPERYFYLGALQAFNDGSYALTGMHNPGEPRITWQQIVAIYPQLANHRDKIRYYEKKDTELVNAGNIFNKITEDGNGQYTFYRLPAAIQLAYINGTENWNGTPPNLTKAISWRYMNDECRKTYIQKTRSNTFEQRFSTFELMSEIKKQPQIAKYVNTFFGKLGVNTTIEKMMFQLIYKRNQFEIHRRSKKNPNIEILHSLSERKYGIFDSNVLNNFDNITEGGKEIFYKKNGILYDISYLKKEGDILISDNGEHYITEIYYIPNGADNDPRNFYTVLELTESMFESQDSYFFSQRQYEKLVRNYFEGNEEPEEDDIDTLDTEPTQNDGEDNQEIEPNQVTQINKKEKGSRDLPSFSDLFELDNYDNKE